MSVNKHDCLGGQSIVKDLFSFIGEDGEREGFSKHGVNGVLDMIRNQKKY